MKATSARGIPFVLLAFQLSGAAALIYEVTWTRALALVLGSTTYAVSTMLATFMSGLALGAALGGKLADRSDRLLFHFGLCELGIGLTGLVSVPLIYLLPAAYLAVGLKHLRGISLVGFPLFPAAKQWAQMIGMLVGVLAPARRVRRRPVEEKDPPR